ncbi:MAG: hypothetical protein KBT49_08595, partial [Bacteroidetes bacterium]|nr:hypothetical protein [Candidatus Colenecus caballi]
MKNRRMPNGTYGGVRGRKTKVGRKLLRFPPTRFGSVAKVWGWRFAKLAARKLPRPIPCKFGIDTATKAAFRYQTCTKNALQTFRLQDWQTFGGRRSPEWGFAP